MSDKVSDNNNESISTNNIFITEVNIIGLNNDTICSVLTNRNSLHNAIHDIINTCKSIANTNIDILLLENELKKDGWIGIKMKDGTILHGRIKLETL